MILHFFLVFDLKSVLNFLKKCNIKKQLFFVIEICEF